MSNTNTGGPAFPSPTDGMLDNEGMTLRDYFAAKAAQGMMAGKFPINSEFDAEHKVAKAAYIFADAMLKAREA